MAEGKPFLNTATRAGTVVYVAGEGVNGIVDKVAATIGKERARDAADPIHRRFLILPGMPALTDQKGMQVVLEAVRELGVRADLVIVDTVARALGAAALDENSTEDMGRMVAALDFLRQQTGAALLGNHHAGKSGTDRGSSALRGAADVFAKVERVRPMVSRLVVEDMRDGEPAAPVEVTWGKNPVGEDEHGPIVRWFVLSSRNVDRSSTGADDVGISGRDEAVLAAVLRSPGPCRRSDVQAETDLGKTVVGDSLRRLKEAEKIQQVGFGAKATYIGPPVDRSDAGDPGRESPPHLPLLPATIREPGAGRGPTNGTKRSHRRRRPGGPGTVSDRGTASVEPHQNGRPERPGEVPATDRPAKVPHTRRSRKAPPRSAEDLLA